MFKAEFTSIFGVTREFYIKNAPEILKSKKINPKYVKSICLIILDPPGKDEMTVFYEVLFDGAQHNDLTIYSDKIIFYDFVLGLLIQTNKKYIVIKRYCDTEARKLDRERKKDNQNA